MIEMPKELVLASTSPRRRELITRFDLLFHSVSVEIDESPHPGETPSEMVKRLAQSKARSAIDRFKSAIVVAADTTVELDNLILGKPADAADAARMLRLLRGRAHRVHSGVVVRDWQRQVIQLAETVVWMRGYLDEEIDAYVATGDPLDKAAAYAIQHPDFHPVERIEGCYANVMGLPLCRVLLGLEGFGVSIANYISVMTSQYERDCPVARHILAASKNPLL